MSALANERASPVSCDGEEVGIHVGLSPRGTTTSIDSYWDDDDSGQDVYNDDDDEFLDARDRLDSEDLQTGLGGLGGAVRRSSSRMKKKTSYDDLSGLPKVSLNTSNQHSGDDEASDEESSNNLGSPSESSLSVEPIDTGARRIRGESDVLREEEKTLPEGHFFLTKIDDNGRKIRILAKADDAGDIATVATKAAGHDRFDTATDILGDVKTLVQELNDTNKSLERGASPSRRTAGNAIEDPLLTGKSLKPTPSGIGNFFGGVLRRKSVLVTELGAMPIPVKAYKRKSPEYGGLFLRQCIQHHTEPLWAMAFNKPDPKDKIQRPLLLATAGSDRKICIWELVSTTEGKKVSATSSGDAGAEGHSKCSEPHSSECAVFEPLPWREFDSAHKSPIASLAWNKGFLLSGSLDKTAKLWHVDHPGVMATFEHPQAVTSVVFHPSKVDNFVTGSFDNKLRVWSIQKNKVVAFRQTPGKVFAASYSPDGSKIVAGMGNGTCIFYNVKENSLDYHTQIECRNRHGKLSSGRKVSGFSWRKHGQELLVTTNDSRVRLYRMRDYSPLMKLKGAKVNDARIQASFNESGTKAISGGEDGRVVVWSTEDDKVSGISFNKFSNKNYGNESFVGSNSLSQTVIFGPSLMADEVGRTSGGRLLREDREARGIADDSRFILVGSSSGTIRVYEQRVIA